MNKSLLTVAFIATSLWTNAQNLLPSEAVKLINQPSSKAISTLEANGYSFDGIDDSFYIFHKGRYELSFAIKQGLVTALSSEELVSNYREILMDFESLGLKFSTRNNSKFPDGIPNGLPPNSDIQFDKKPFYTCIIIAAYNLNQSLKISVIYGKYTGK